MKFIVVFEFILWNVWYKGNNIHSKITARINLTSSHWFQRPSTHQICLKSSFVLFSFTPSSYSRPVTTHLINNVPICLQIRRISSMRHNWTCDMTIRQWLLTCFQGKRNPIWRFCCSHCLRKLLPIFPSSWKWGLFCGVFVDQPHVHCALPQTMNSLSFFINALRSCSDNYGPR